MLRKSCSSYCTVVHLLFIGFFSVGFFVCVFLFFFFLVFSFFFGGGGGLGVLWVFFFQISFKLVRIHF